MLRDTLTQVLKSHMKAKNMQAVTTIRGIQSAIKDKDIAARAKGNQQDNGIDDTAILALLQSMIKQRRDSISQFEAGNRPDLVAKEQAEIAIIEQFLPKQLDGAALESVIRDAIAETGAVTIKDMGKVMGVLKSRYTGQMDMGKAGGILKGLIG